MSNRSFTDSDQVARLRVAVRTGRLPRDLGAWVLGVIEDSPAIRVTRDRMITDVVRSLSGSEWSRCRDFLALVAMGDERVEPLVTMGCPLPTSWRQVHRICVRGLP